MLFATLPRTTPGAWRHEQRSSQTCSTRHHHRRPKRCGKAGITRFFYSCRSTAGGRPRCKGVHYPAWEFEQAVCEIFNDPATWRDLLGSTATDELIVQVMETWSAMLWPWKRDWLKGAVKRIEIDEADSTVNVTFSPDAAKPFLQQ